MAVDYQAQLEALRQGEKEELVITPDEFMEFQKAYRNYQYKGQISGDARRGGEIHYHKVEEG